MRFYKAGGSHGQLRVGMLDHKNLNVVAEVIGSQIHILGVRHHCQAVVKHLLDGGFTGDQNQFVLG
jgi:hypothetical protein